MPNKYNKKELKNLNNYVSESEPNVNKLLRANLTASEYIFDSLFEEGMVPQPLYRLINNEHIHIQD